MKIEHVAIWARDLEKLKVFYETYFEAKSSAIYINSKKGFSSYFLSFSSGPRLELMQMPSVPETRNDPASQFTGYIHIAISVGSMERVDSLTLRLRQDGFAILDGPRKTGDGYYESTVLDPENNRIEIAE